MLDTEVNHMWRADKPIIALRYRLPNACVHAIIFGGCALNALKIDMYLRFVQTVLSFRIFQNLILESERYFDGKLEDF